MLKGERSEHVVSSIQLSHLSDVDSPDDSDLGIIRKNGTSSVKLLRLNPMVVYILPTGGSSDDPIAQRPHVGLQDRPMGCDMHD